MSHHHQRLLAENDFFFAKITITTICKTYPNHNIRLNNHHIVLSYHAALL